MISSQINSVWKIAIKFIKDVMAMCIEGGQYLIIFASNIKDVFLIISKEKRRNSLPDQKLRPETLPTEKALGV